MPIPDLSQPRDQGKRTVCENRRLLHTTAMQRCRAEKQYKNANKHWHLQMQCRQLEPNGEAIFFYYMLNA